MMFLCTIVNTVIFLKCSFVFFVFTNSKKCVEECQYKCSALNACVNASVWCDGIQHCPSGDDETFLQCSAIMKLPTEILATLCLIIVLFCCAFAAFAYK